MQLRITDDLAAELRRHPEVSISKALNYLLTPKQRVIPDSGITSVSLTPEAIAAAGLRCSGLSRNAFLNQLLVSYLKEISPNYGPGPDFSIPGGDHGFK